MSCNARPCPCCHIEEEGGTHVPGRPRARQANRATFLWLDTSWAAASRLALGTKSESSEGMRRLDTACLA